MIYLRSFDLYREILEYNPDNGAWRIIERGDFERMGLPLAFGRFMREDTRVLGVFASPDGPVFFLNEQKVFGRFGKISAEVILLPDGRHCFILSVHGRERFRLEYRERYGIGANPYDTEIEDIDLGYNMAAGMRLEQFFRNYTISSK